MASILGAGIKIMVISNDFRYVRLRLKFRAGGIRMLIGLSMVAVFFINRSCLLTDADGHFR